MARATAAVGGGMHLTPEELKERNAEELNVTKAELEKELQKLIGKIGIVNVLVLLYGLNEAEVTDVYNPHSGHYTAHGWFSLKDVDASAVNVDTNYRWQERWCMASEIRFGQK